MTELNYLKSLKKKKKKDRSLVLNNHNYQISELTKLFFVLKITQPANRRGIFLALFRKFCMSYEKIVGSNLMSQHPIPERSLKRRGHIG